MTEIADDVPPAHTQPASAATTAEVNSADVTTVSVIMALSASHMLNDTIQALIPSIYPLLKETYHLEFSQIGLITFVYQCVASLLQPMVGSFTDKRPLPYSLAVGMTITLVGLLIMSAAGSFHQILIAAAVVGSGSAIFHPEASRLAYLAAGKRRGFAQSMFQVGGNFGTSLGPLLAAWIIMPRGQWALALFSVLALIGMAVLVSVGRWYSNHLAIGRSKPKAKAVSGHMNLSRGQVMFAMGILMLLIVSKYFYLISLTNYYTFYLIHKFGVSVQASQIDLFLFLFAVAAGTIIGGPLGDRYGRRNIIWVSILGVAPFSLLLPHVGLAGTIVLSIFAGFILASAFSAILVYAQELAPGRVGLIAGLFFGFAFGVSGIASAALGELADRTSIETMFLVCSFLPLIGICTMLLPKDRRHATA